MKKCSFRCRCNDINRQSYLQDSRSVYLNQRVFLTVVLGPIVTTAEISATNERAGDRRRTSACKPRIQPKITVQRRAKRNVDAIRGNIVESLLPLH